MLRWCAYCHRFLGERPPYRTYAPTHGICARCEAGGAVDDDDAVARIRPIVAFHSALLEASTNFATANALPRVQDVLARGRALGIRPADLLMGVLQPLLYEVGRLWEVGALSPTVEARFSAFAERVLEALVLEQQRRKPRFHKPPIFVVVAPSNRHTIGARMLGFILREHGHDARVVTEPVTVAWLVSLAKLLKPAIIGVSIALPDQVDFALELLSAIEASALGVRVVLGGAGVDGLDWSALPPSLEPFATMMPDEDGEVLNVPSSRPTAPSSYPGAPSSHPGAPSSYPGAPSSYPGAPSSYPPGAPSAQPSASPSSEPGAPPSAEPRAPSSEPGAPPSVIAGDDASPDAAARPRP